jgi:hypothetical protein
MLIVQCIFYQACKYEKVKKYLKDIGNKKKNFERTILTTY